MCGIAGVLGEVDERVVAAMTAAIGHRGPDDRGLFRAPDGRVTLGQTRLAIIDCSPRGHQPMASADGRLHIVYNGEVYNYRELRALLEQRGRRFRTATDTEVLLEAYAEWGPSFVERLTGMFAFVIVDGAKMPGWPDAMLVRDRLGIKPLLYADVGGRLLFASELRALLSSGLVERRIDDDALLDYFAFGSAQQPRTLLRSVRSLPPGHRLELHGDERRVVRYYRLHEATRSLRVELARVEFPEARDRLRELLLDAARHHLVADVPVGAFLSGGIDSTAVVGLLSQVSGARVRTFCVGFAEAPGLDERKYAAAAASWLGTAHEDVVIDDDEVRRSYPRMVAELDQPSTDGANIWFVSRAARASVKVAISGLGGDELFGGYPHFSWLLDLHGTPGKPRGAVDVVLEAAQRLRPTRLAFERLLRRASPAGRYALLRRLLPPSSLGGAVRDRWAVRHRRRIEENFQRFLVADGDAVQEATHAELGGYLLSTLLRDGDAASMAHGLEMRPVLLHHPLVEFAYALPASMKVRGDERKRVLAAAVREYLPPSLRERPKVGFELPIVEWMAGPLANDFAELLATDAAAQLFSPRYVASLRRSLKKRRPPRALWAWGALLRWIVAERIELA